MAVILPYKGKVPKIDPTALIAPNATIVGDVTIMEGANIWFNVVIRGDLQPVVIGRYTNVQDNATIHVMGDAPTIVGDYVTIGHNTLIHCSKIGNNCLIGMGSTLLGYTEIGENTIIGAASLLTQHKKIPHDSLVYGNPSRIIRALREDEVEAVHASAMNYCKLARVYREEREAREHQGK